ncbi:MAG: glycosyltransferase [Lachnospiraceae bacterium]
MCDNKQIMFSIIIPVYNRCEYIDRCVESVLGQTYLKWEAILIDDGSTDNSLERCQSWSKQDNRIKCIERKHAGQGAARNSGIDIAKGAYLLFLDSDDWWDHDLLEQCAEVINTYSADIILFDMKVYQEHEMSIPKRLLLPDQKVTNCKLKEELLCRTTTMANKCFEKKLLDDNQIRYPLRSTGEDDVILPICLALGKRIYQIKGAFYNYDRIKHNSVSDTSIKEDIKTQCQFFEQIKEELEGRKLFSAYKKTWGKYELLLAKNGIYPEIEEELAKFILAHYPQLRFAVEDKFLVFGSYNLRSAVNYSILNIKKAQHYQFSSLIAAISHETTPFKVEANNNFRQAMFEQERNNHFFEMIKSKEIRKFNYICIDFLEERFDILNTMQGYVTLSDVIQDAKRRDDTSLCQIVCRDSKKAWELWKEKCDILIENLKQNFDLSHVILVKSYLFEYFGSYGKEYPFENLKEIRKINEILAKYYQYFQEHAMGIQVLDANDSSDVFSDIMFKHGCFPWHANEIYYYTLSDKLGECIEKMEEHQK